MRETTATTHSYQDIRDALRPVRAEFAGEHHRQDEHGRAYPVAFVDALTKAGGHAASARRRRAETARPAEDRERRR